MHPLHIEGGVPFGAPKDWDPDTQGEVFVLWVRSDERPGGGRDCTSAWTPTPKELEAINRGGPVYLRCVGGQPPVMVWAEPPEQDQETDALKAQAVGAYVATIAPGNWVMSEAQALRLTRLVLAGGLDVGAPPAGPKP